MHSRPEGGAEPPAARAFATEELARALGGLAGPEALALLPPAWAVAARDALSKAPDARTRALATRVIDHESGDAIVYYAPDVYVLECLPAEREP
jgi:hypothetical protein